MGKEKENSDSVVVDSRTYEDGRRDMRKEFVHRIRCYQSFHCWGALLHESVLTTLSSTNGISRPEFYVLNGFYMANRHKREGVPLTCHDVKKFLAHISGMHPRKVERCAVELVNKGFMLRFSPKTWFHTKTYEITGGGRKVLQLYSQYYREHFEEFGVSIVDWSETASNSMGVTKKEVRAVNFFNKICDD